MICFYINNFTYIFELVFFFFFSLSKSENIYIYIYKNYKLIFKIIFLVSKKLEAQFSTDKECLNLDKVLLINKVSRLDVERYYHPDLTDKELEENIKKRGIDYESLVKRHKINDEFQNKVLSCFNKFGITIRNVNRFNCTHDDIEWCTSVFPIGGDGTFLYAARQISNTDKPVIGFNSDPSRSEGYLCLPKKYSNNILDALKKLINGDFRWMFRTRIRVTLNEQYVSCVPTELYDVRLQQNKVHDYLGKEKGVHTFKPKKIKQKVPVLALNEVFMSEIFAAKISHFEMRLNNSNKSVKIKSSGLCVCTGTGSTSWNLSINRLSQDDVRDILKLYISETKGEIDDNFTDLVSYISHNFNDKFQFEPEKQILWYTIRDLISLRVWPYPKGIIEPRGYAKTIELKSKCLDAAIIVDGAIFFPFNEGAISILETHPEDALRTVVLND
ncbi:NADH kinase, putative [Pediculus humanus corporis]|uniref:NADH kinase, putative n=1 Tax=Pediculus humanus subsp. corporis TaxID=121224 RepID=E0VDZ9_PEDHC|nr:NADH kinase, putative [Pediculus humanus corporis]EEB11605.1 NADH kinase, putative [Pediculus humanus corporis]